MKIFIAFLRDRKGATAIEYALVAGGIALAVVAAITNLGNAAQGLFEAVAAAMK